MNGVVSLTRACVRVSGERNGRCKLTNRDVHLIRLARANRSPRPSYDQLAAERGVHPRTIRRVCRGLFRLEAGGPIEQHTKPDNLDDGDDLPPAFDTSRTIKCGICGHTAFPAWANPDICYACHVKQHSIKIDDVPLSLDWTAA